MSEDVNENPKVTNKKRTRVCVLKISRSNTAHRWPPLKVKSPIIYKSYILIYKCYAIMHNCLIFYFFLHIPPFFPLSYFSCLTFTSVSGSNENPYIIFSKLFFLKFADWNKQKNQTQECSVIVSCNNKVLTSVKSKRNILWKMSLE